MRYRRAFTLIEVTIVSGLMAFLAMLLASAWVSIGSPTANLIRSGQCMQEIDMAVSSLARDLGGSLPNNLGGKKQAAFSGWYADPSGTRLTLSFNNVDTITYDVENGCLIRKGADGVPFTVSANVTDFQVTDNTDFIQIELTFTYPLARQTLVRKCTLRVKPPPVGS
jgi:type II secretory pathway pseudopilin PulG